MNTVGIELGHISKMAADRPRLRFAVLIGYRIWCGVSTLGDIPAFVNPAE